MLTLHDITLFKSSSRGLGGFEAWLLASGSSEITVENYSRAVGGWLKILDRNDGNPTDLWAHWHTGKATKRMAGFACRRYAEYVKATSGNMIDLGVPNRLPLSSRPNPKPISDTDFRKMLLSAKRVLPRETGFSMRVWLQFVSELGLRRSESEVTIGAINWQEKAVRVTGKTGERELPLSRKMVRRLAWLHRRNGFYLWRGARGQELRGRTLYNLFQQICTAAGLPDLHPHLLRHRRLTALCRSELGRNQLLVLSFSGHAHVSSLQPYYAVSLAEKRALLSVC